MTADEIITKFELQVSDMTELSSEEELDLLNDKYQDVCSDRPWEFLKKPATGALTYDATAGMFYITKPEDFSYFCENANYTDNTMEYQGTAQPKVVFVGAAYQPYQIISYSDRIQYRYRGAVCYLDPVVNRIYFPLAPSDTSLYQFDYIRVPTDLGLLDSPVFPERFHKMLQFAMATDNDILQLSNKAKSYAAENLNKYEKTMGLMESWNAKQLLY